jgi:hypothetical protein
VSETASIPADNQHSVWEDIKPLVNSEAEFLEIASDFGNPLEIVREAISNSIDSRATNIKISFTVEPELCTEFGAERKVLEEKCLGPLRIPV